MFTFIDSGDAGYSLQLNVLNQTFNRQAYWVSGGGITPGTSNTEITVRVESGEANVSGNPVSWAGEELVLADAGVGPNGQPTGNPRVDVISATSNGALSVTTGEPAPYAPDTDANGNKLTPQEFEQWEPAPDDGQRVGGCVLGLVLVKPDWSSAQDITSACIDNDWKLSPGDVSRFVKGNGQDNGDVTITTTNSDFILRDPSDAQPNYLWKDESDGTLKIGSADATPTLQANLDADEYGVKGVGLFHYSQNAEQTMSIDSGAGPWELHDRNPQGEQSPSGGPNPIVVSDKNIFFSREPDFNGADLVDVNSFKISDKGPESPLLDMHDDTNGRQEIWRHSDGKTPKSVYTAESEPADNIALRVYDATEDKDLLRLSTGGTLTIPNGGIFDQNGQVN